MADLGSRVFFLLGFLAFTLSLLHHPTTCHARTLFVFGDGLYDAGNKQFLSSNLVSANAPPYGITIGKATGRWSDGLIVPDYLADFMGIPLIPPILNSKSNFSHGASFAVADATVLGSPADTLNLEEQEMKFSDNKNKWTDKELSEAIYLFHIGGNDYLNYIKNNPSPSNHQKQVFVDQVITGIDAVIKALYGEGGRKFAFQNLEPLGCLPAVKQESEEGGDDCIESLPSEMAALHNKKLLQLLGNLARNLKGFQYSYYNFFNSIQNRVVIPNTYWFETGNAACCGTGAYNGSGCTSNTVCSSPGEYLFFDGMHLTQNANFQISHLIWGSDPSVIQSINLRELLFLPLDIPVIIGGTPDSMAVANDSTSKIHSAFNMEKLEWGTENQWPYNVGAAGSYII